MLLADVQLKLQCCWPVPKELLMHHSDLAALGKSCRCSSRQPFSVLLDWAADWEPFHAWESAPSRLVGLSTQENKVLLPERPSCSDRPLCAQPQFTQSPRSDQLLHGCHCGQSLHAAFHAGCSVELYACPQTYKHTWSVSHNHLPSVLADSMCTQSQCHHWEPS